MAKRRAAKQQQRQTSLSKELVMSLFDFSGEGEAKMDRARHARWMLYVMRGDWLGETLPPEARRLLASLLVAVYAAGLEGNKLTKREACEAMGANVATTGPKYIGVAEKAGLIEIELKSAEDRRKAFLRPTKALDEIVERLFDRFEGAERKGIIRLGGEEDFR